MTSVEQVVERLAVAGCDVVRLGDGKMKLTGEVPEGCVPVIREQREEFLRAWDTYKRDRYCKAPPATLLMRRKPPAFNASTARRVQGYVMSQDGEVGKWVLLRAAAYRELNWTESQAINGACSDVLHWQLERHPAPTVVIMDLEEGANECVRQR